MTDRASESHSFRERERQRLDAIPVLMYLSTVVLHGYKPTDTFWQHAVPGRTDVTRAGSFENNYWEYGTADSGPSPELVRSIDSSLVDWVSDKISSNAFKQALEEAQPKLAAAAQATNDEWTKASLARIQSSLSDLAESVSDRLRQQAQSCIQRLREPLTPSAPGGSRGRSGPA